MQRNIYAVFAACLSFLIFTGEAFGHHNSNHKVILLGHWIDTSFVDGWFCRSEVPILHSMRAVAKKGLIAARGLLESSRNIKGEPTCDEGIYQIKVKRILAQIQINVPDGRVLTAIEVETKQKAKQDLYTITWMPVLKPEDDPETLTVGQSVIFHRTWKLCDTKKQAENIVAGYQESFTEGGARYRMHYARRNTRGERVCGTMGGPMGGLVDIMNKYKTVSTPKLNGLIGHLTLFELRIRGKTYFSWTDGAVVGPPESKALEHKI